ncbi:MAG: hypothetical protein ABW321_01255, partial [Polyangiales bacterium]
MNRGLAIGAVLALCALLWMAVIWPVDKDAPPPSEPSAAGEEAEAPSEPEPEPAPAPPQPSAAKPPEQEPDPVVAAPQPPAAPAAQAPANQVRPMAPATEPFAEPHGPIEDYRAQFAAEPRDSAASDVEKTVRDAFQPELDTSLFRNVLCRQSLCRVEMRWSPGAIGAYVAAMGRMSPHFDRTFAAAPLGAADADQNRMVEL